MTISSKIFTSQLIKVKQLFDKELLTFTELKIEVDRLINDLKDVDIEIDPLDFIDDCSILIENNVLTTEEFENLKSIILSKKGNIKHEKPIIISSKNAKTLVEDDNLQYKHEVKPIVEYGINPEFLSKPQNNQYNNNPLKPTPSRNSNKHLAIIFFCLVGLILLIFIINSLNNGNTQNNKDSNNKTTDYSNNSQTNTSNENQYKPKASLYSPDGVVVKFIESLGKRDFSAAFALMTEKRRGSYSQFNSTKGYGGITSTSIFSCSYTGEINGKYEVMVDYESIDPANRSGRFRQYFYLINFKDSYLISEIKNISLEWY